MHFALSQSGKQAGFRWSHILQIEESRPHIYWALAGPRDLASARLHGYLIHEYLLSVGWSSSLVYDPTERMIDLSDLSFSALLSANLCSNDVIVFQKLHGHRTLKAMEKMQRLGVRIIYIDCDYPLKLAEARLADAVLCSSTFLAELYRSEGVETIVVPEMYEAMSVPVVSSDKITKCVWFGCFEPVKAAEIHWLRDLIAKHLPTHQLVTVWNGDSPSHMWQLETAWSHISSCDVAVITGNESVPTSCKSPNRVIQAMALGLPVIAFPIPSYTAVIRHGRNGFLCRDEQEWIAALLEVKTLSNRVGVASSGYRFARRYFNSQRVGAQWKLIFSDIMNGYAHRYKSDDRLESISSL